MGCIQNIDDCTDAKIVGQMGANLAKASRAGLTIARGFVVPMKKYIGYGATNEIIRKFDDLGCKEVILRASPMSGHENDEVITPVHRERLVTTIEYMQQNAERRWSPSAILVQECLDGEFCGRIYTENPFTRDENEMIIETQLWASKSIIADEDDTEMILLNKKDGSIVLESNEDELYLEPQTVQQLYHAARKLEAKLDCPLSIDWGIVNGVLYILKVNDIKDTDDSTFDYYHTSSR